MRLSAVHEITGRFSIGRKSTDVFEQHRNVRLALEPCLMNDIDRSRDRSPLCSHQFFVNCLSQTINTLNILMTFIKFLVRRKKKINK
jgi:hypothetical protein